MRYPSYEPCGQAMYGIPQGGSIGFAIHLPTGYIECAESHSWVEYGSFTNASEWPLVWI